nr:sigma 54-interacting transcriptional regulator [Bacilli bacterium]
MDSMNPVLQSAYYEQLLYTLPEAVTVVDRQGKVLAFNRAASSFYGIPQEEIIGRPIGDFFQRNSLMLLQVMENQLPVTGAYHQPTPGKHVSIYAAPVFDASKELIGAISIEQDITSVVLLSQQRIGMTMSDARQDAQIIFSTSDKSFQASLDRAKAWQGLTTSTPLLLLGEVGVGKAMLARHFHEISHRKGPFIAMDCRAVTEGLLDIELFGFSVEPLRHEEERKGKLEIAAHGTLWLSHIDQMAPQTQNKLAQALLEGGYQASNGAFVPLSCHVIASIIGSQEKQREAMDRLEDSLRYALEMIYVPKLSERKEDLPSICHFYLTKAAIERGKSQPEMPPDVMNALSSYAWPGNLYEVKKVMEQLMIVSDGEALTVAMLPRGIRPETMETLTEPAMPLESLAREVEQQQIEHVLRQTNGNKAKAARILGISRGTLYYKMRNYGLLDE